MACWWRAGRASPSKSRRIRRSWSRGRSWSETWEDDGAHSRFLELAATVEALDVAAAKYRRRKLAAADDEKAERGLQRAVTMAQTLYVARAKAERPPRTPVILKIVGTMFAGLILLAAIWVVIVTFARHR